MTFLLKMPCRAPDTLSDLLNKIALILEDLPTRFAFPSYRCNTPPLTHSA